MDDYVLHNALYAWPFSERTLRRWRNSKSGMRASPIENRDWRWHPTPKRMPVIWQSAGTDQAGGGLRRSGGQQGKWGHLAGQCCSATSGLRQYCGSAAVSGRGFKAGSRESGSRGRSRAGIGHGGRYGTSRVLGPRLGETLSAGHPDAVALAACDSGQLALDERTRLPP